MALRNKNEKSYRGIAIGALNEQCRTMALKAKELMPNEKMPTKVEDKMFIVATIISVISIQHAARWLVELDEKLCPNIVSMEAQVSRLILEDRKSPDEVVQMLTKEVESMIVEMDKWYN